jgi:hypothetical protein
LHKAAGVDSAIGLVWAIEAEKILGTYDAVKADQRVTKLLVEAERSMAAATHSGSWQYAVGMLQAAHNQKQEARESFQKVLILADSHMSHHLAREALAQLSASK